MLAYTLIECNLFNSCALVFNSTHALDCFNSDVGLEYAALAFSTIPRAGQLGPYLAGMIKGDGSLIVPALMSGNSPTIYISFNIKDLEFAKFLMSFLGGSIQLDANTDQAFRLVFRSQADILNLIELINGHMCTPKISALVNMIDFVNHHNGSTTPIIAQGLETAHILSNA